MAGQERRGQGGTGAPSASPAPPAGSFPVERYEVLGAALNEGVLVYDDRGRIVVMNAEAARLLGLSDEQVAGSEPVATERTAVTVDGQPIPLDALPVPVTQRTGEAASMVFGIDRVGAPRRWLDVRTAPLAEGGVVATVRDATDVKQAADLDRATIELATVAVEAVDDVGGVVLQGFLQVMGQATDADRAVFVVIDHAEGRAGATHDWSRDGSPLRRRVGGLPIDLIPILLARLSRHETVAVPDLSELPDDLLGVRLVLDVWVLAAVVVVPVLDEGRLIGFVTLGWNEPTALPDRVASFAGVAVGMLGSLVTRERVHAELQELNETLDDRVRARSNQLAEEQDRVQALIDAIPDLMFELDPDGVFVNIARGSVVDQPAMVELLVSGKLGGAGLDVFADEPRVPEELFALDSVVLQPHQGSATSATRTAMGNLTLDNIRAWEAGKPLVTPV